MVKKQEKPIKRNRRWLGAMYIRFVVGGYKHAKRCLLFLSMCVYAEPGCLHGSRQNPLQHTCLHTITVWEAP